VLAFLLVAASDGNVDKKEVEGFGKVLHGLAAQQGNAAVARMMRTTAEQLDEILPRILSGKTNPAQTMQALNMLINDRFSEEDAQIMKASLLFLAHQVAASSGGFLGMGPKISKDEKAALAALADILGLRQP
jgi:tellurite resistance protein